MKREIIIRKEIYFDFAECKVFVRHWENGTLNGEEDDAENPKMPCVKMAKNIHGKAQLAWCPVIDLNNGQIVNWREGETARLQYKSCDENEIGLVSSSSNEVCKYFGYVPDILDPHGDGYGDYVTMNINEQGFIEDFNNDIDDILHDLGYELT